jgi:hypothetical protein
MYCRWFHKDSSMHFICSILCGVTGVGPIVCGVHMLGTNFICGSSGTYERYARKKLKIAELLGLITKDKIIAV